MPRPQHNTTSLPRNLRAELGIRDTYGDKKRQRNGPAARKDRRRAERNEKKSRTATAPARKTNKRAVKDDDGDEDEDDFDMELNEELSSNDERPMKKPKRTTKTTTNAKSKPTSRPVEEEPIQGHDQGIEESESETDEDQIDDGVADDLEDVVHVSAGVKSKLAQDDAEIAALEKKLGLKKGKKLPKAFAEDGLEDLLGDLGEASDDESKKRKREADEWLQAKRRKARVLRTEDTAEDEDEEDDKDEEELDSEEDVDNLDDEIFGSEDDIDDEDSEFDGFDEEEQGPPKKKENPYVAPVSKSEPTVQKYIPPSLRARRDPETESLTRLKRQAQGHLNKLSEANLVSILAEFEKLYRDYPRQHVTSTLIDLLMGLICERSVLQDTFIVLHAGFVAAVYKILGMDFGAEIVQKVVETLDAEGDERGTFEGKQSINLVSLLSQLYNFHVIGSPLMFDYIRLFLQEITETNTELLLKVIRSMFFWHEFTHCC